MSLGFAIEAFVHVFTILMPKLALGNRVPVQTIGKWIILFLDPRTVVRTIFLVHRMGFMTEHTPVPFAALAFVVTMSSGKQDAVASLSAF
jgi:hypothetical protein